MNVKSTWCIAMLAVICTVTGCTAWRNDGAQPPPSMPTYTVTVSPLPPPTSGSAEICPAGQIPDGNNCINCPQLKPCFIEPDEMHVMAGMIYPAIEEFSTEVLDGKMPHARWFVIATGQQVMSACTMLDSRSSPMFCGDDDTIYIGEDGMWDMYNANDRGDAINVVVMAHEWGHHVQMHMGAMSNRPSLEQTRKQEMQADCISGAAAQFMHGKGYFSDDDLAGVLDFIPGIPSDPEYSHGTNEQRLQAFKTGYDGGMVACNPLGIGDVIPG